MHSDRPDLRGTVCRTRKLVTQHREPRLRVRDDMVGSRSGCLAHPFATAQRGHSLPVRTRSSAASATRTGRPHAVPENATEAPQRPEATITSGRSSAPPTSTRTGSVYPVKPRIGSLKRQWSTTSHRTRATRSSSTTRRTGNHYARHITTGRPLRRTGDEAEVSIVPPPSSRW